MGGVKNINKSLKKVHVLNNQKTLEVVLILIFFSFFSFYGFLFGEVKRRWRERMVGG